MTKDDDLALRLEHASKLRHAIAVTGADRRDLAEAVNRNYRTLTNWMSQKSPTMPTAREKEILRRILGPYDAAGDPVEIAVKGSRLTEDRQYVVLGVYKRELRQQDEENEGRRPA